MSKNNNKNWDDLVLFDNKGVRKVGEPKIRILKGGTFLFNVSLVQKAKLELHTHAALRYSKRNNAIVFEFLKKDTGQGTLKITQRTKEGKGNSSITSRSFFTINYLDLFDVKGKYAPVQENIPAIGNRWIIYLDEKDSE